MKRKQAVRLCAGKAKYDAKKHALVWKVKRYLGMSEHALTASVELIATTRERKPWGRPPIAMAFQVNPPPPNPPPNPMR